MQGRRGLETRLDKLRRCRSQRRRRRVRERPTILSRGGWEWWARRRSIVGSSPTRVAPGDGEVAGLAPNRPTRRDRREAHIPTEQPPSQPQARLPGADEHPWRPGRVEVPSRQGPRSTVGLIARLRDRDAFVRLRRDGVRVRGESLWCSYVADDTVIPPQVGFALTRAIGTAVTRNRLRRRLRAILASLDVPNGLLLVGATPAATELTFDELRARTITLVDRVRGGRPVTPEPS